jgi:hypothetical protein
MKRKLLPYGMPLGGAGGPVGSAMGSMGSAASGGKSNPAPQNAYGSSYQAPAANVYQPSYSAPQQGMGGGKSSGLGQGGYGGAPSFGGQQPTAQTQPSFEQSPFGAGPSSVNTTTTADMMGGNRGGGQGFGQVMQGLQGGKSSGLGQGGYGMAPGFGGQPQPGMMAPRSAQYRTKEQEAALDQRDYQNYSVLGSQPSQVGSQQGMGGFGIDYFGPNGDRFSSVPPPQQGMGALGGRFNPYQSTQQMNPFQQQFGGFQQPQQQFNPFQQQFGGFQQQPQFNPYQQQQFNPFQQQFGGFQQQQPVSGLRSLFNNMMGQQQMQRQPMQQYQDPALQYRPNMQNAQSALSRVRPSVQRQNQDAQSARIAELEAQLARFNTPSGE